MFPQREDIQNYAKFILKNEVAFPPPSATDDSIFNDIQVGSGGALLLFD